MFGNKTKESGKNTSSVGATSSSHAFNSLVQGTTIEGDIKSKNDIRVDGTIKGSLKCEAKVVIGPTGAVEGEVVCATAVIEGRFEGDLNARELLIIKEKANVHGQIRYGKLVVQPGAVLVGDVRMGNKQDALAKKDTFVNSTKSTTSEGEESVPGKAKVQKETAG